MPSFVVVSTGSSSLAMAAELSLKGFEVKLFELEEFRTNLEPIVSEGGVEIQGAAGNGKGRLRAYFSAKEALDRMDFVVMPSTNSRYLRTLAPSISEGQTILFVGGYFHALNFVTSATNRKLLGKITVSEFSVMPYAGVLRESPTKFTVNAYKKVIQLAAYPATRTPEVLTTLREAYPQLEAAQNILESSLNNLNPMFHPPILLLSTSTVDAKGDTMLLYKEGVTESVAKVIQLLDDERLMLVSKLGLKPCSSKEWLLRLYGTDEKTLFESLRKCKAYEMSKAPRRMTGYLDQDIPYGLVPIESISKTLGLRTPSASTMIDLASMVNNRSYRRDGYSATKLGVKTENVKRILQVATGSARAD